MVNKPYCIDLYAGDDVVDYPNDPLGGFKQVKSAGIAFLDHKASEGPTWKDTRIALRRKYWMDGVPVKVTDINGSVIMTPPKFGFYHFNGPMTDVGAEFLNFNTVVKPLYDKGDDLCLDWEPLRSGYEVPAVVIDEWCQRVEQAYGQSCKVYGGNVPREQFQKKVSSDVIERFQKRRLWFCEYAPMQVRLPLPWQSIGSSQWQDDGDQYGPGPHHIPGIERYCDNSTVTGAMTVAKLLAAWGQ